MTTDFYMMSGADAAELAEMTAKLGLDALDDAKRRQFDKAFASMSEQQKQEFQEKVMRANTSTEKMRLITNAILDSRKAQLEASSNTMRNVALITIGGGILLLGTAYLIKSLRKK